MSGLYYKSNNARENAYEKARREQEILNNKQQDELDIKHMENLSEMSQAATYGRLMKNTFGEIMNSSEFSGVKKLVSNLNSTLTAIINSGKLDETVKSLISIPSSNLTPEAKIVIKKFKDPSMKDLINVEISNALKEGATPPQIAKIFKDMTAGKGEKGDKIMSELLSILEAKGELNASINSTRGKKFGSVPEDSDLAKQSKAMEELDLLSLFQQDVKEGKKRIEQEEKKQKALEELEKLNAEEDLKVRTKFHNMLDEMKAVQLKQAKDKQVVSKLMELLEREKMAAAFEQFSKVAMDNALREKIQRNIRNLFYYKKNMATINKYTSKEAIKQFNNNLKLASVSRTGHEQSLVNTKREGDDWDIKSEADTVEGSLAGQKIDRRMFNTGAPKKDTNVELNDFTDLLIEYFNAGKGKKKASYDKIKNIIKRQPNEKIRERMNKQFDAVKRKTP